MSKVLLTILKLPREKHIEYEIGNLVGLRLLGNIKPDSQHRCENEWLKNVGTA